MLENEYSNIGMLTEVKDLMLSGDSSEASDINNSVIDTNLIEANKRTVNDIYLNGGDTISSADSATLYSIATQLAVQGGEAVYWARGKLRLDIEDSYNSAERQQAKDNHRFDDISSLISVYPNPSGEKVTVTSNAGNIQSIIAENILGETILFKTVKDNKCIFDVSHFANGAFILKINLTDKKEVQKKLTVIH